MHSGIPTLTKGPSRSGDFRSVIYLTFISDLFHFIQLSFSIFSSPSLMDFCNGHSAEKARASFHAMVAASKAARPGQAFRMNAKPTTSHPRAAVLALLELSTRLGTQPEDPIVLE
jgi:hypothetical protein